MQPRCNRKLCAFLIMVGINLAGMGSFFYLETVYATATTHYVAPDGVCGGRAPCYNTLQAAVDAAQTGDKILVASGIYTKMNHYAGLVQSVYLSKTISLRGGYSPANWEPISSPTPTTILDAQKAGRVIYITGAVSPTLENLTIMNGDATKLAGSARFGDAGGGIYIVTATVTLSNVSFQKNFAVNGGAIYAEKSRFTLRNSQIISNVGQIGGGIFLEGTESYVSQNLISGNQSEYGGGLAAYGGYVDLTNNRITLNRTNLHGGGILYSMADGRLDSNHIVANIGGPGGGAMLSGNILAQNNLVAQNRGNFGGGLSLFEGDISLFDNTIIANQSGSVGGGISVSYHSSSGDPAKKLIARNVISGNQAQEGGGIFLQLAHTIMTDNLIQNNVAEGAGGGLYVNSSKFSLDRTMIIGNRASQKGGGLFVFQQSEATMTNLILADNSGVEEGSGLYLRDSQVTLSQGTLANNVGPSGVFIQSGISSPQARSWLTMTNVIVTGHSLGIASTANSFVTVNGILWFANGANSSGTGTHQVTHVVEGDPAFIAKNYRLTETSAALDAGLPSAIYRDIDQEPRPFGLFDLGADEFWPAGALRQIYLPVIHQ